MVSRAITDLDPRFQLKCNQFLAQCWAEGINAFITQTYRSNLEQDRDYAQGRTAPGKVITNARAGQSPHNCVDITGKPAARAFDFAIKTEEGSVDWNASDAQWTRAIDIGISLGMVSGSQFHSLKDNPHLEMPNWKLVEPWNPAQAPTLDEVISVQSQPSVPLA